MTELSEYVLETLWEDVEFVRPGACETAIRPRS